MVHLNSFFPFEMRKNIPRPRPENRRKDMLESIGITRPGGGGPPRHSLTGLQATPPHLASPGGQGC